MERASYDDVLRRFRDWAAARPDVLGLVAVGSTAGLSREPDRWSDHDVLVVVSPGAGPRVRADLAGLPGWERLLLVTRETEEGFVLLDADGHLVELALLEPDEMGGVVLEDARVLLDRGGVVGLVDELRARSGDVTGGCSAVEHHLALFAKHLVVGLARHARGERLSGHEHVRSHAVRQLLALAWVSRGLTDDPAYCRPDPFRRVETVAPALAAEVAQALSAPVPVCASVLVALAERELPPQLHPGAPAALAMLRDVVRERSAEAAGHQ